MGDGGKDERFRDAVCDAAWSALADPLNAADPNVIARAHGVPAVDRRFNQPDSNRRRLEALNALAAKVSSGRLMCWYHPKRGHAEEIAAKVRQMVTAAAAASTAATAAITTSSSSNGSTVDGEVAAAAGGRGSLAIV